VLIVPKVFFPEQVAEESQWNRSTWTHLENGGGGGGGAVWASGAVEHIG